jgi:hypothetical protein
MPAPIEAASPTTNAFHELWVAKAADQAGLDDLQDEPSTLVLGFVVPDRVGHHLVLEARGELVVLVLGLCEVAEQLADRRVGRAGQSLTVEPRRGALHVVGVRARSFEAQRLHLPDRLLRNIAPDMLAADERNVVAEFRDKKVDEPTPMRVLLGGHLVEHFGGRRIVFVQAVREIGVDARILLLVADGEGEYLALGQVVEIAHDSVPQIPASSMLWRGSRRETACECRAARSSMSIPAF